MIKSKFTKEINSNIASPEVLPYLMSPFSKKRIIETRAKLFPEESTSKQIPKSIGESLQMSVIKPIPEEVKNSNENQMKRRIKINHSMSLPMKFRTFETIPDLSRDTPLDNVSESSAIFDFEKVRQLPNQTTLWSSESAVYEQLELLGKGNQSKVMKIKEKGSGQIFAGKINMNCKNSEEKIHLDAEFTILKNRIKHPFVLKAYEIFHPKESPEDYVIILEYFQGITLREAIENKIFDNDRERLKIFKMIVEGINAVHKLGISHRDLSLDNILISESKERIKIIDFGLAKDSLKGSRDCLSENAAPLEMMTATGLSNYRAPEVIKGDFYTDKIDVWMCGLILLQLFLSCPKITTKKVLKDKSLMQTITNKLAYTLLELMLVENPEKRCTIESINIFLSREFK